MLAKVTNVIEQQVTGELAEDATAGQDTFTLEDISVLAWPSGQITIGGFGGVFDDHDYTVVGAEEMDSDEVDLDEAEDPDGGVITIDPVAVHNYSEGTYLWPAPYVFERLAYLFMEDQEEEIVARIPQSLYDRIPTGTREDPEEAETVEIELRDNEYVVADLVGEEGPGLTRGYDENLASVDCSAATLFNPVVLAEVAVDIPTTEHRVLVWYSAEMSAANGTVMQLGLDDNEFDFPVGSFELATFTGTVGFTGPALVMPLLPQINVGGATITIAGHTSGGFETPYMATSLMPYNLTAPTTGLHNFRLVASRLSGMGACSIDNAQFWVTVV